MLIGGFAKQSYVRSPINHELSAYQFIFITSFHEMAIQTLKNIFFKDNKITNQQFGNENKTRENFNLCSFLL